MKDTTPATQPASPTDKSGKKIEFLQYHLPPVMAGNYSIDVTQQLGSNDKKIPIDQKPFTSSRTFTVMGERYALNPQDVLSVFPPDGSNGDHANVLPHVILNRSTLPWEREPEKRNININSEAPYLPWLAILLFDAENAPKPKIIDLGNPGQTGAETLYGDNTVNFVKPVLMSAEGGEHPDDRVTVIDVTWDTLEPLLPTDKDLPFLAHVRQWMTEEGGDAGGERAVVIGNRLPKRGGASVAHLVSLEHRYIDGTFWRDVEKKIRLVSLKSWRFQCLEEVSFLITPSVLRKLDDGNILPKETVALLWGSEQGTKRQVRPELRREFVGEKQFLDALRALLGEALTDAEHSNEFLTAARYKKLSFKSLLMELDQDTFKLPMPKTLVQASGESDQSGRNDASRYLEHSYVPMPHHLRNGETTASWYRGPLLSGPHQNVMLDPPVLAADHLLRYNKKLGMFDASYAAAWELGRLLILQAKNVSLALFNWKRAHAHRLKGAGNDLAHLPFNLLPAKLEAPASLRTWLYNTALLEGVPFNYLVPDPRMLPKESIRFFHLDKLWVECLLDGAFSVGRVISSDLDRERTQHAQGDSPIRIAQHADSGKGLPEEIVTGVLIRSEVVAGWPDLQVDGYAFLDLGDARKEDETIQKIVNHLNTVETLSDDHVWRSLAVLGIGMPRKEDCRVKVTKLSGNSKTGVGWDILDETGQDSSILSVGEIKNVTSLAVKLQAKESPVSTFLWKHLTELTQGYLANIERFRSDIAPLERALVNDLNRIIRGHSLYEGGHFTAPPLPSPAPKGAALQRFNRRLLEQAYPDEISRKRERMLCQIGLEKEDGKKQLAVKLPLLRIAHLSKSVLLCLFHGEVEAVDVHQKPEALHFGVSEPDPRHETHYKELRHSDGTEDPSHILQAIPWRDGKSDKPDAKGEKKTNRVINIEALAKEIGDLLKQKDLIHKNEELTSADIALQMIEGVQRVRFNRGKPLEYVTSKDDVVGQPNTTTSD
jgi:hypothetical protein